MARALEMDIEDLSALGAGASRAVPISSVCSVFAESEVVSHIAEGHPVEAICRGICESVAERTAALLKKVGRRPVVAMTGGVAKNAGVVKALERRLGGRIATAPEPQIIGALGPPFSPGTAPEGAESLRTSQAKKAACHERTG